MVHVLEPHVDRLVALLTPESLRGVGLGYDDFEQLPDERIVRMLEQARREQEQASSEQERHP